MKNIFLALALCTANAAFAQKFDLGAVTRHIETANRQYGERFQTGAPAFYEARYTADACIMPDNMEQICGRDNIAAYYYNNGLNKPFRLRIATAEISGGPQTVVEEGTYELGDSTGQTLDKGKFIATWVRENSQWKLRREIWNSDMPDAPATSETGYDSLLAQKLGADDYGMRRYVLVLLKTGPANITDKATVDSLFAGHMANIGRLASEGKLVLAGPIGRKEKYRGLYIFNVADVEEARSLTASDPAVAAGLLESDIMPYYGSAALRMLNEWHERVQKVKF